MHVIMSVEPIALPADNDHDERLVWVGEDDRGVELEVVAIQLPDLVLVIHVMPTHFRKRRSS